MFETIGRVIGEESLTIGLTFLLAMIINDKKAYDRITSKHVKVIINVGIGCYAAQLALKIFLAIRSYIIMVK